MVTRDLHRISSTSCSHDGTTWSKLYLSCSESNWNSNIFFGHYRPMRLLSQRFMVYSATMTYFASIIHATHLRTKLHTMKDECFGLSAHVNASRHKTGFDCKEFCTIVLKQIYCNDCLTIFCLHCWRKNFLQFITSRNLLAKYLFLKFSRHNLSAHTTSVC